ncbi:hypothetical protein ACQY0O_002328 [Thecaphora frezii]
MKAPSSQQHALPPIQHVCAPIPEDQQSSLSLLSSSSSLDLKQHRRLFLHHSLALLPTLILLAATLLASVHARASCTVHTIDPNHDKHHVAVRCYELLDTQMVLSCLALGVTAWLASYASRRSSWSLASSLVPPLSSRDAMQHQRRWLNPEPIVIGIAVLLQSLVTEGLRIFSFYLASCILLARLHELIDEAPPISGLNPERQHHSPPWAWRVSFHDPRFFMALWVSLAWSWFEFISGACQILRQLALYRPNAWPEMMSNYNGSSGWSRFSFSRRSLEVDPADQPSISAKPNLPSVQLPALSRTTHLAAPSSEAAEPHHPQQDAFRPLHGQSESRPLGYGTMASAQPPVHPPARRVQLDEGVTPSRNGDDDAQSDAASVSSRTSTASDTASELDVELEDQVQQLLLAKERAEIECVLGAPLPDIPVVLCSLWRLDAMLWSMGSGLLLSAIFAHSQGTLSFLTPHGFSISKDFHLFPMLHDYVFTFSSLVLLHAAISGLWATSLASIGFASATYGSLLVGISLLVVGLARWGFLV